MEENEKSIMELSGYKPTDIVLAKVKGYPQWPAMVLDESILPDYVLKKKPKTMKIPPKKKNSPPAYVIPVRFFSDDTYIWIKSNEILLLTTEMIDDFLNKPKRRKDNLLESAYKLARNPLDIESFVKYGSSGKPLPEVEYESEAYSESINESESSLSDESDDYGGEPKKKKAKSVKAKSTRSKSKPLIKQKKSAKGKPGPKPKTKPIPQESDDSYWGIEEDFEDNYRQGNYIYEDIEEEKRFIKGMLPSDILTKQLVESSKQFDKASSKLISQLLDIIDYISEKERKIKEKTELELKELRDKEEREAKEQKEKQEQEPNENVKSGNLETHIPDVIKVENSAVQATIDIPRIEVEDSLIQNIVDGLEELSTVEVPKTVIHKSKIFKLLILVNRKVCNAKLNDRINSILKQWANLSIDLNPLETPNSTTNTTPIENTPIDENGAVKSN